MTRLLRMLVTVTLLTAVSVFAGSAGSFVERDCGVPEPQFARKDVTAVIGRLRTESGRIIAASAGGEIAASAHVTVSASERGGVHFLISADKSVVERNESGLRRLNLYVAIRYLELCFAQDQGKDPASADVAPFDEYLKRAAEAAAKTKQGGPNKSPLPTSTSVTPRADARVAPAGLVAGL